MKATLGEDVVRIPDANHARRGSPAIDVLEVKLAPPQVRRGIVPRRALLQRLRSSSHIRVISVVAPPGFGKTTLLSQWAQRNGRDFAWVSLDERDNDPRVLLTYVAVALDRHDPIDPEVFRALASPRAPGPMAILPRFGSVLASRPRPTVVVLDDVHVIRDRESRDVVARLESLVGPGSQLALTSREDLPIDMARLRAQGVLLELGPDDLAMDAAESRKLLSAVGVSLPDPHVVEIHRRTEGWPVGLYLAALALKAGGERGEAGIGFAADDRFVAEYLESEILSRLSRRDLSFLTRTSILERMNGSLCDAVLETTGSEAVLRSLRRSNLLLQPLDRGGNWYRYHHLFRGLLLARLERREPEATAALRRRAADWCNRHGMQEDAVEYSIAADDVDTVAEMIGMIALPVYRQGRVATVQRWFQWLHDRGGIDRNPVTGVLVALLYALTGSPVEAEHWAEAAERGRQRLSPDGDNPWVEGWCAMLRSALCKDGIERMRADAMRSREMLTTAGYLSPTPLFFLGLADLMGGDPEAADRAFADAIEISEGEGTTVDHVLALTERSLIAMNRGDWERAEEFVGQARSVVSRAHLEDYATTAPLYAASARILVHVGDVAAAREDLVRAQRLRGQLTYAIPHLAVQFRLELGHAYVKLADEAGARTLLREALDVLKRRPDLGSLVTEVTVLQAQLAPGHAGVTVGASTLTAAELRLLPYLGTHLSFREIGERLYVSRHTVKTQAISVYRKLGVSSRSEAVGRGREIGLLDA